MSAPSDSVSPPSARADVIHNIGFRHYAGKRLGRGYVFRTLFVHSLLGAYGWGRSAKSKILPLGLFAVMILPAGAVIAIMNVMKSTELPMPYTRYAIFLQAIVSIFVAAQAPQLLSRDLRFRTTTLYFSRPLTGFDYVTAKFGAMVCALFILMATPLVVLYVGVLLTGLPVLAQTGLFLAGLAGVVIFSLVLAGFSLLIAAFTPRRGLGVAAIITLLVMSSGGVAAVQGVAAELGNLTVAAYVGLFSPFTLVDGIQVWLLGAKTSGIAGPSGPYAGLAFWVVMVAVVVTTYGLLLRRYRKVVEA